MDIEDVEDPFLGQPVPNAAVGNWELSNEMWFGVAFVSTVVSMLAVTAWQMEFGWLTRRTKKDEDESEAEDEEAKKKDSLPLIRGSFGKKLLNRPKLSEKLKQDVEAVKAEEREQLRHKEGDGAKYVHFARDPGPDIEDDGLQTSKVSVNGTSITQTDTYKFKATEQNEADAGKFLIDNQENLHGKLATAQYQRRVQELERQMSKEERDEENKAREEQLNEIFKLMEQDGNDKFNVMEQMRMYGMG